MIKYTLFSSIHTIIMKNYTGFYSRFQEIQDKLTPYLKKCGFNPKNDIFYIPVSGLTGANLHSNKTGECDWYK